MKEIVERLKENRQIELAKEILESAGYEVSKRVNESETIVPTDLNDWDLDRIDRGKVVSYTARFSRDNYIEFKLWDQGARVWLMISSYYGSTAREVVDDGYEEFKKYVKFKDVKSAIDKANQIAKDMSNLSY